MRLYAGHTNDFVQDATRNNIARLLENAFVGYYRYKPSHNEIRSWEESLLRLSAVVSSAKLNDHGIFLEYQLPQTSRRLDAMLTGRDENRGENAVIIELKQWEKTTECDADGLISTWLGGQVRDTLHPSVQAGQYRDYLADMHTAFHEGAQPIALSACAYLHNYRPDDDDPILARKFASALSSVPLFGGGDTGALEGYLDVRLRRGQGLPILDRIEKSKLRPSKTLLSHVAAVIDGEPRFVLLDEQRVVFERALAEAKHGFADKRKRIMLVQGGPGTGKSVLAANLLGRLSKDGLHAQYATGSRAFTGTLRKIVGKRAASQFTYFNNYGKIDSNTVDVLICDEAHRIREKSFFQYTPKAARDAMGPQIDELIKAAKVSIFFIDDRQVVRPGEKGSAEFIRAKAEEFGAECREYRLEAQFRCAGSDAFVNWVDNTLGVQKTANQIWNQTAETFEVRVFSTVESLDQAIRRRAADGASARLVAGYCWHWSKPNPDGTLVEDVVIGNYRRAWNAKPDAKRLAKGIPKATLWAHEPGGIDQIGCVYTAQGFEFDYVGVILGRDLRFDPVKQDWVADKKCSHDATVKRGGAAFADFVKNTYRVLLSRGMKGCYLYFEDVETAKFFLGRTEGLALDDAVTAAVPAVVQAKPENVFPLLLVRPLDRKPFQNCIPVLDLKIAAGQFGEFQTPDLDSVDWVAPPGRVRASMDLFVAQVIGESMNLVIPNGSWCLFRRNPGGTRNGKIVLAQLQDYRDPEGGGAFTIKRYESVKGEGFNIAIKLKPESSNVDFQPIEVSPDDEGVHVVAEFLQTL